MINKIFDKPFKLISVVGIVYLITNLVVNLFTDLSYKDSFFPYANIVTFSSDIIVIVLCIFTFVFYNNHYLYFLGLEILIFSNLYNGSIHTSLFFSSILLVILLTEKKTITAKYILIYTFIEIIKLLFVIPFGVMTFFSYIGLTLFALCTIGCINLLFRHAYNKKDSSSLNLNNLKLSERQKDCIKEIVINNTTIKALAINHNVSESAIKKDLAHIYKILDITGKADLKALFIGYEF